MSRAAKEKKRKEKSYLFHQVSCKEEPGRIWCNSPYITSYKDQPNPTQEQPEVAKTTEKQNVVLCMKNVRQLQKCYGFRKMWPCHTGLQGLFCKHIEHIQFCMFCINRKVGVKHHNFNVFNVFTEDTQIIAFYYSSMYMLLWNQDTHTQKETCRRGGSLLRVSVQEKSFNFHITVLRQKTPQQHRNRQKERMNEKENRAETSQPMSPYQRKREQKSFVQK